MESELERLMDALPGLVWTVSLDGRADYVGERWLAHTGMERPQAAGEGWQAAIHPADRAGFLEIWRGISASGRTGQIEARLRGHDGRYLTFEFRVSPVRDDAGVSSKWCWLALETASGADPEFGERDADSPQALVEQIFTKSRMGSFRADVHRDEHVWSQELYDIFEFEPGSKVSLEAVRSMLHPEDVGEFERAFALSSSTGVRFDQIFRVVTRSGVLKHLHSTTHTTLDVDGRPIFIGAIRDLSTEEALMARERELRRAYRHLVEAQRLSATGSFIADLVADQHHWSDEFYRLCEFEPGSRVTIERFESIIHPEDRTIFRSAVERGLRGESSEFLFRIVTRSGAVRYLQGNDRLIEQSDGHPVFVGAIQDVTRSQLGEEALKAREAELRRSNRYLAEAQRLSRTGSFTWDMTRDEQNWSAELYRIWGFEPQAVVTIDMILEAVQVDDRDRCRAVLEQAARGEDFEVYFRIVTASGARKHLHTVGHRIEEITDRQVFVGATQDVTESTLAHWALSASEAELRTTNRYLTSAQRLSKTGSWTWDTVNDGHDWSEETYRIWGLDPEAAISLEGLMARVHPEDSPRVQEAHRRAAETGEDYELFFRIVMPGGAVKYLHTVSERRAEFADGPVFVGATQDISESTAVAEALNTARNELAHVTRAMTLSTLTASIAHEVSQPIAGIITNAGTCLRMLATDPPNLEGARATAQRTIRDGNRASEVIRRLRDLFSRKPATMEPVDLNDAAREVLAICSGELRQRQIMVSTEFSQSLPAVIGDRIQLQQVILNLLRNASDAVVDIRDRPRQIFVKTCTHGTDCVALSVRDTGAGLDVESADRLFDAFYTSKPDGMGIGLSISRSIAESHNGRLTADTNDGPGATFTFAIPCGVAQ